MGIETQISTSEGQVLKFVVLEITCIAKMLVVRGVKYNISSENCHQEGCIYLNAKIGLISVC